MLRFLIHGRLFNLPTVSKSNKVLAFCLYLSMQNGCTLVTNSGGNGELAMEEDERHLFPSLVLRVC